MDSLKDDMSKQDAEIANVREKLGILSDLTTPKYIVSNKYGKWHISLQYHDLPAAEWRVRCGWRYGKSIVERRSVYLQGDTCSSCFDVDGDDSDEEA